MSMPVPREAGSVGGSILAARSSGVHSFAVDSYEPIAFTAETPRTQSSRRDVHQELITALKRRWARERRRRKVGRAYDMALEIARLLPKGSEVLDVGCGNGFIAHHLSAMLGVSVIGIDLPETTEATIDYRTYCGEGFPLASNSVDAVLLCYVLHHAQNVDAVINEIRRVLRPGGLAIVYEDIPRSWPDRLVCWFHNKQWQARTGICTFRSEREWRALFETSRFEILNERQLSRWRNFAHVVTRRRYVIKVAAARSVTSPG